MDSFKRFFPSSIPGASPSFERKRECLPSDHQSASLLAGADWPGTDTGAAIRPWPARAGGSSHRRLLVCSTQPPRDTGLHHHFTDATGEARELQQPAQGHGARRRQSWRCGFAAGGEKQRVCPAAQTALHRGQRARGALLSDHTTDPTGAALAHVLHRRVVSLMDGLAEPPMTQFHFRQNHFLSYGNQNIARDGTSGFLAA